jgi:Prokaryotic membrane lipoprotein lipid attachment site
MKKYSIIIFLGAMVALTSCSYQKTNNIDQDDLNKDSEYVYGVHPDSSAKQLKNKYTEKPENAVRATELREKLFGKPDSLEQGA